MSKVMRSGRGVPPAQVLDKAEDRAMPAARQWLEFPDPDQLDAVAPHQVTQVFRVDMTWLTSRWACTFGRGCPGIMASRPHDGCCTLGAHFSDADDEERVRGHAARLDARLWQRRPADLEPGEAPPDAAWIEIDADGERKTSTATGACVFLNDPDFASAPGCALHHLAVRQGSHALETKPDVCWQLPLRRTYRTVTRGDGSTYLEVTIAEYDRLGWGPGGLDLDWYCTDSPAAHVGNRPVYRALEPELRALVGDSAYHVIAEAAGEMG